MTISIGIVGLPNSGKSTLFNVLVNEKKAKTLITPFTTVAYNEGTNENIRFVDVVGLVRGSHRGQGFGNASLEKIRGVDVILHVVRAFYSNMVSHPHKIYEPGSIDQVIDDIEVVKEELRVAGIHKPQIYVLNFDDNKISMGVINEYISRVTNKFGEPVVFLCAKFEEQLIGLTYDEAKTKLAELNITKIAFEKISEKASLLLSKNSLN